MPCTTPSYFTIFPNSGDVDTTYQLVIALSYNDTNDVGTSVPIEIQTSRTISLVQYSMSVTIVGGQSIVGPDSNVTLQAVIWDPTNKDKWKNDNTTGVEFTWYLLQLSNDANITYVGVSNNSDSFTVLADGLQVGFSY